MYLVRLIYASKITPGFNDNDIRDILESARRNNAENNVTGMLCFAKNCFLQCLEGGRKKVNETYHKILNDQRHNNIVLLDYREISEREFDDWWMGYIPDSQMTKPINLRYSPSPHFDPFEMSGESCHQMMLRLKETVPTI